jgi:hypothetical protein
MKPKQTIDDISAEVKSLIGSMKLSEIDVKQTRALAQPKLQLIWKALEAGQVVSGCKTKGEWAKYANVTTRYCQYIIKDGSRKRIGGDANPVRKDSPQPKMTLLDFYYYNRRKEEKSLSMMVDFEVGTNRDGVIKLSVRVPGENVRENYDVAVKKMTALLKQHRLWSEATANYIKEGLEEYFKDVEVKPTPAPKVKKEQKQPTTHKMNGKRTFCGKTVGDTLAVDAKMSDDPTCRNCQTGELNHEARLYREMTPQQKRARTLADRKVEHTGQHTEDYCDECFEYQQEQERIELKWKAAYEAWRKRIQTLINTWRNGRLREESKYREEFEAAGVKFQKRVEREGTEHSIGRAGQAVGLIKEAHSRMEGAIADRNKAYPSMKQKDTVYITHAYDGASAGGGQNTRMYSYALCGRRFTPHSDNGMTIPASGIVHESAHNETPTCPKCIELAKQKAAQVPEVLNDCPTGYDTEAYAKAETWSQKRCIIGSPENLQWSAELKQRRELEAEIGEVGNLDGDDEDETEEDGEQL